MSNEIPEYNSNIVESGVKGVHAVRIAFFILKVANMRCFILIAVEIVHDIIP
jgi:hypothetical protein